MPLNGGVEDTLNAAEVLPNLFDFLGVRLNAAKAEGKTMVINWSFTDSNQRIALNLDNSALTYVAGKQVPNADATVTLARGRLDAVTQQRTTFADAVFVYTLREYDAFFYGDSGLIGTDGKPLPAFRAFQRAAK